MHDRISIISYYGGEYELFIPARVRHKVSHQSVDQQTYVRVEIPPWEGKLIL